MNEQLQNITDKINYIHNYCNKQATNIKTPYKHSEVIRTPQQLYNLVNKMEKLEEFAFDTETNTLRVYSDNPQFRMVGISLSWGEYDNYYIPVGHIFDDNQLPLSVVVTKLKPIFEREDIRLIGHNLKFDLHVLARIGIYPKTSDLFDTMVASWICDENTPNGLKDNTQNILGVPQDKIDEVFKTVTAEQKKSVGLKATNKPTFDLTRIDVASKYAIDDSYYTWKLYLLFLEYLEEEEMEDIYYSTYPQFIKILFEMEEKGIAFDIEKCKQMDSDMQQDLEELDYRLIEMVGTDMKVTSSQQLAQLLFGYSDFKTVNEYLLNNNYGFKPYTQTSKGVPQTNTETIKKIARLNPKTQKQKEGVEFCKLLLEYKKLSKLQSFTKGFIDELYADGRIHCSFNPVGTSSGRISCSAPNLIA